MATDSKSVKKCEMRASLADVRGECRDGEDDDNARASCSLVGNRGKWSTDESNSSNSPQEGAFGGADHHIDEDEITSLLLKARSIESICGSFDGAFDPCPSPASNDTVESTTGQSLLSDVAQTQLALWTFTLSIAGTYWWQKRAHIKALVVAALLFNACALLSMALLVAVLFAHVFRRRDWASQMFGEGYKGAFDGASTPNGRRLSAADSRRHSTRSQSSTGSTWSHCGTNLVANGDALTTCANGAAVVGNCVEANGELANIYSYSNKDGRSPIGGYHAWNGNGPGSAPHSPTAKGCCSRTPPRAWQRRIQTGSACYGRQLRTW